MCIVFVALTAAADDVILDGVRLSGDNEDDGKLVAAEAELSDGRDRWRVSCVRRPNIEGQVGAKTRDRKRRRELLKRKRWMEREEHRPFEMLALPRVGNLGPDPALPPYLLHLP